MKNRVNITLDPKLHKWAKAQADRIGVDFSAYVTVLIKRDQAAAEKPFTLSDDDMARLRRDLAEQIRSELGLPASPAPPAGAARG